MTGSSSPLLLTALFSHFLLDPPVDLFGRQGLSAFSAADPAAVSTGSGAGCISYISDTGQDQQHDQKNDNYITQKGRHRILLSLQIFTAYMRRNARCAVKVTAGTS